MPEIPSIALSSNRFSLETVARYLALYLLLSIASVGYLLCPVLLLPVHVSASPLIGHNPPRAKPFNPGKSLSHGGSFGGSASADPFTFDLKSAVDVLSDSTELDLYDPITLSTLRRLKDDATPAYNPADIDPVRTRHVAEKAFAIQAGKTFANILRDSELGPLHRQLLKNLEFLQGLFSFAVTKDTEGIGAGHNPDGERLFTFDLHLSPREGFDPQIKLNDSLRLRYDLGDKQTMLEYALGF